MVDIKSQNQINYWANHYQFSYSELGFECLYNEADQVRKPTLDLVGDMAKVRKAVEAERQRFSQAKRLLEEQMGESFHFKRLKRFLKNLSAETNAFGG